MREGINRNPVQRQARLYLEPRTRASETRHYLVCEQHPRESGGLAAGRSPNASASGSCYLTRARWLGHTRRIIKRRCAAVLGIPSCHSEVPRNLMTSHTSRGRALALNRLEKTARAQASVRLEPPRKAGREGSWNLVTTSPSSK
jgi:hypothetical protein